MVDKISLRPITIVLLLYIHIYIISCDQQFFTHVHSFCFQTFYELTNDNSQSVPCQAGFVPPLPSFPFENDSQEHSLGSSDSSTSESWPTPPPSSLSEDLPIDSGKNSIKTCFYCAPNLLKSINILNLQFFLVSFLLQPLNRDAKTWVAVVQNHRPI